ncbi:MAG: DNA polymerase IV [Pseudomonadota bacterium]
MDNISFKSNNNNQPYLLCLACNALYLKPDLDQQRRCAFCRSRSIIIHKELSQLCIAHIDCDSFFASVEKRDNPHLIDKPLIIGGRERGVVAAACYIARMYGVHSAMSMFEALKKCPKAVVLSPDIAKYRSVGQQIKTLMRNAALVVEPLSIDEAYLKLPLHTQKNKPAPCQILSALLKRIEYETGISASAGLSYNKMLAKLASDLDKPRGFSVIGQEEAIEFLASLPVSKLWGVGQAMEQKLKRMGLHHIGQLQQLDEGFLRQIFGKIGNLMHHFANAKDPREVKASTITKNISVETTFAHDIQSYSLLHDKLENQVQDLMQRMQKTNFSAHCLTLKLRDQNFQTHTRTRHFFAPTLNAQKTLEMAIYLLQLIYQPSKKYRLLGLGFSDLHPKDQADPPDLFDDL